MTDLPKGTYHLSEPVGQTDESLNRMRQFSQAAPASVINLDILPAQGQFGHNWQLPFADWLMCPASCDKINGKCPKIHLDFYCGDRFLPSFGDILIPGDYCLKVEITYCQPRTIIIFFSLFIFLYIKSHPYLKPYWYFLILLLNVCLLYTSPSPRDA